MQTHTTPENHTCTYTYDSRDRVTLSDWNSTTPDTHRGYWPGGLIKFIDNGISRSDYHYNSRKLLTSEIQTISGQSPRTVSYHYDADGLRLLMETPSNSPVNYEWTAKGQLRDVNRDIALSPPPPDLATYTYDKAGRPDLLIHENGITQDRGYDDASQLLNITHTHNGVILSGHSYQYDNAGRRTAETFLNGGTPARDYDYDAASQVTTADYGAGQADSFDYDAMGNRTSATIASQGGGTFNYGNATSANQYTSITGRSAITHDANGNQRLNGAGAEFTWDSENRLLTVTPVSPSLGDKAQVHSYDGLHRRVTRTTREWTSSGWTNLETTYFIYDGWNVIEEWTSTFSPATAATLTRRLTWGQDLAGSTSLQGAGGVGGLLMVEEITSTTTAAYHFHYDGNGNVTEITDHLGAPVATYRYDAFGNTLVENGTYAQTNRYRFSTKPLDHEVTTAPLYYYGYRYYDPLTGRWPSRDPIEEKGGVNLYGFVGNDGVNAWDVLGLDAEIPFTDGFDEQDEAGIAGTRMAVFFTITRQPFGSEWCGQICCKDGEYGFTGPVMGDPPEEIEGTIFNGRCDVSKAPCPDGWKRKGIFHSHPNEPSFNLTDFLASPVWGDIYVGGAEIDLNEPSDVEVHKYPREGAGNVSGEDLGELERNIRDHGEIIGVFPSMIN